MSKMKLSPFFCLTTLDEHLYTVSCSYYKNKTAWFRHAKWKRRVLLFV